MKSFVSSMFATFHQPTESVSDFFAQLKQLTPEDKKYYHKALNDAGIHTQEPRESVGELVMSAGQPALAVA